MWSEDAPADRMPRAGDAERPLPEARGHEHGTQLMWMPAVGAIVTQLLFYRTLAGLGWRLGPRRYLGFAVLIPIAYLAAATVCHCTLEGSSAPPHASGTM